MCIMMHGLTKLESQAYKIILQWIIGQGNLKAPNQQLQLYTPSLWHFMHIAYIKNTQQHVSKLQRNWSQQLVGSMYTA